MPTGPQHPDWTRLFELASAQEGYFTTGQAEEAGYSLQLLAKYLQNGRMMRVRRGIYRIVHYPPGEHEDLVTIWLWSDRKGVLSHETALSLHALSDALPVRIHLTLPEAWKKRRFRIPNGVVLHHEDVPDEERVWIGPVPVTSPRRTLADVMKDHLTPELTEQAVRQARRRGMISEREAKELRGGKVS